MVWYGMVWYGMQAANVHLHLNEVFVVLVLAEHHLLHILRQVVEEVSVDAAQLHTYTSHCIILAPVSDRIGQGRVG